MPRYFIEVAYKGTRYAGFQIQHNANTIQAEIEKALTTLARFPVTSSAETVDLGEIRLTGSSRTDAGVHALQNYFHFDSISPFENWTGIKDAAQLIYKLNSIVPNDIVIKNIMPMPAEAHSRFDAVSRRYIYKIHRFKDPFLRDTSLYYPFKLNEELLHRSAEVVKAQTNFFPFSKTNTQVKNFNCTILHSEWIILENQLTYIIEANRFLRGMVRLVTATLLKVGRGIISLQEMEAMFQADGKCGYSVPAHGLFLVSVNYPTDYFPT